MTLPDAPITEDGSEFDAVECCVCYRDTIPVNLVCGHSNVCANCLEQIRLLNSRCPMRRARI